MKQKLIVALMASALGSMVAPAHAGVIQATYKVFAAEAFGGATSLTAPLISYNLSRPVSGSSTNPNTFTIALTLSSGTWDSAAVANYRAVLRDPSSANKLPDTGAAVISNNGTTVTFTFVADQDNVTYPANSTITFGDWSLAAPGSASAVNNGATPALIVAGTETTLATPMTTPCVGSQSQISVSVKMTNASGVEVDTNDPGAIITTPVLASNVALNVSAVTSASYSAIAANNELSKIDVLQSGMGKKLTITGNNTQTTTDITDADQLHLNIGQIVIKDARQLYDVNGGSFYSVKNGVAGTGGAGDGIIDGTNLNLSITGKFAVGATVGLYSDAACTTALTGAGAAATFNTARDTATINYTMTEADWAGAATTNRTAYVCYNVDGTHLISSSTFQLASGGLSKATASKELADPVCAAPLYALTTNGVQIDVRNYIHAGQSAAANGWMSTLRLINTDEVQTVDVMAQYIDSEGNLLSSGKIATLAPRAAKYVGNDVVQNALGALPADSNNSRLRITAAGSSLRVQNYIYDPVRGTYIEASSAQADEGPRGASSIEVHTSK